jgi:hypothetical protein
MDAADMVLKRDKASSQREYGIYCIMVLNSQIKEELFLPERKKMIKSIFEIALKDSSSAPIGNIYQIRYKI